MDFVNRPGFDGCKTTSTTNTKQGRSLVLEVLLLLVYIYTSAGGIPVQRIVLQTILDRRLEQVHSVGPNAVRSSVNLLLFEL
jgi:hypothetical protein